MTLDEFKALPVGTLVKVDGDVGEIIKTGSQQVDVIFSNMTRLVYVGENSTAGSLTEWMEVEE